MAEIDRQIRREATEARASIQKAGREALRRKPVRVTPTTIVRVGTAAAEREVEEWRRKEEAKVTAWEQAELAKVGVARREAPEVEIRYGGLTPGEEKLMGEGVGIEGIKSRRRVAAEKEWVVEMKEKAVQLSSGE